MTSPEPHTIPDALLRWARSHADEPYLHFDEQGTSWTFGQALQNAERGLAGLRAMGVGAGDRVVIVAQNDASTAALLFGAMGGEILPALVHPPVRATARAAASHLAGVIAKAEPALVVGPESLHGLLPAGVRAATAEDLLADTGDRATLTVGDPDAPGYLQFSSGSTGAPKAVMVRAGAFIANCRATAIEIRTEVEARETWIIWLPLYHDMGLCAGLIVPLVNRHRSVLLSPGRFVEKPLEWMRAIDRHRGTLTVAPNFAYALAARRASPERISELDLSSLRLAFNGAEMVGASTVRAFEQAFAPAGLQPNVMFPVYGLAEMTLSAAYWRPGEPIRVDAVERGALARGRADPAPPEERRVIRLVSVGHAITGHDVRIVSTEVDPHTDVDGRGGGEILGRPLGDRQVGEIQMSGPSVMLGYWRDEAASTETLVREDDGTVWLRTGDLGYLAEGDLFICGRKKNIVVRFGENFFPEDLDRAAATAPGIKHGRLACIGVPDPRMETERVWLVFETSEEGTEARNAALAVRDHVLEMAGFKFDGITAVPMGFIEKTSSGKVRRFRVGQRLDQMFRLGDAPPTVGRWPAA